MDELKVLNVATSSVDLSYIHLSHFSSDFYLWHSHLDYVSVSRLRFLVSTGALGYLHSHYIFFYCSGCKLAKYSALLFQKSVSSFLALFDIVHSDVCDMLPCLLRVVLHIAFQLLLISLVTLEFI